MRKLFSVMFCTLLLSACVSEDGAKQHEASAGGVQWSATIYSSQSRNAKTETIGEFKITS